MTIAALLASHGDRGGDGPNATLLAQADAVARLTSISFVSAGVLKGDPALEEALAAALMRGHADLLVYPLFMADGYFVQKVLPERLAAGGYAGRHRILTPLGLDPALPALMIAEATAKARAAGVDPAAARLLVVGHGSKLGPASANATRLAASRIAETGAFAEVATAFLEEPPFVEEALTASTLPTIVQGFFFGEGMHAAEDVPEAIQTTGADAVYTGAIGASPGIPALIAAAIDAAAG